MATQLSAVTMIGTTGQGATDGLRFVQFYFGLPLAMVILGVTLVPFLHGARVFTAYEYLDRKSTRLNSSHGYISYAVFCLKKKKKSTNFRKFQPGSVVHKLALFR